MARPGRDVVLVLLLRSHVVYRVCFSVSCAPRPRRQPIAFLLVPLAMSTSTSCPIPGGRDRLPDCYSTTPGGTLYATTPGGQRAGLGVRGHWAGRRVRPAAGREWGGAGFGFCPL